MVRLCLSLELGVEEPVLRSVVKAVGAEDLLQLKEALKKRLDESLPAAHQLRGRAAGREAVESGFLI